MTGRWFEKVCEVRQACLSVMNPSPLGFVSLLVLLAFCDGGHGPLAFIHVAYAGPLSAHGLLPQGHLDMQNDKQRQRIGHWINSQKNVLLF